MEGERATLMALLAGTSQPDIPSRAVLHDWGAESWAQDTSGSQMSPPLPLSPPFLQGTCHGGPLGFLTPRAAPGPQLLLEDTLAGTHC